MLAWVGYRHRDEIVAASENSQLLAARFLKGLRGQEIGHQEDHAAPVRNPSEVFERSG